MKRKTYKTNGSFPLKENYTNDEQSFFAANSFLFIERMRNKRKFMTNSESTDGVHPSNKGSSHCVTSSPEPFF